MPYVYATLVIAPRAAGLKGMDALWAGFVAKAVANALSSLGVEPRQLPLTPSYLWELVQQARSEAAGKR